MLNDIPGANVLAAIINQASCKDSNGHLHILCTLQSLRFIAQSALTWSRLTQVADFILAVQRKYSKRPTKSWKATFKAPRIFTGAISER